MLERQALIESDGKNEWFGRTIVIIRIDSLLNTGYGGPCR